MGYDIDHCRKSTYKPLKRVMYFLRFSLPSYLHETPKKALYVYSPLHDISIA